MEMMLAENIRRFRKERGLTQEQLAEVFGVSTGAVYKWEAKLSQPELDLIVQLADFFDISVDVLLGYEMRDNRLEATVRRLQEYRRQKDREGLPEAEKALKKYPYSFKIVNECASIYRAFGFEERDRSMFLRALELLEQSRLLLPQNNDPEIDEQTLWGKMAEIYCGLNEVDKAVELWKKHNAGGMYDCNIGHILAMDGRTEEAEPFLSEALAKIIAELCSVITGYMNVFLLRGDYSSAEAILSLGIGFFSGLKKNGKPNFLDKISAAMFAALAGAQFLSGRRNDARASLGEAYKYAVYFDGEPSYDESDIRFIRRIEGASAHDDIGATAVDAVENAVKDFENQEFSALWSSVKEQKEKNDND